MKKNILKKTIITIVSLIVLIMIITFIHLLTKSSDGIPHGTYYRMDSNESIINEGPESAWIIKNGKAEHRYLVFTIVNIEGSLYFEIERAHEGSLSESESGLFRYEVKYDNQTKTLSVTMPSSHGNPYHIPTKEFEMVTFQFKKTGFNIG